MTICNNATFSIEALTSSKTPVEHWFRMNCSVLSLIVTTEDGLLCALVQVNQYISFDLHVVDLYHLSISCNASQERITMLFVYYKVQLMYLIHISSIQHKK